MFKKLIATAAVILVAAVGTAAAQPTAQGLRADGLRLQAMADRYERLQAIKADGLRWQAAARAYAARPVVPVSSSGGFDWADAGIGAVAGLGLASFGGAALVFARRSRRTKLAL